ncbi:uncharacterized protein IUM83_11291 [Phytophthora cinnamomi]|uniref:uncharacterized protein n=1 Tax=Phytophthora cinnamomi TaxID=4785 RepID=UPI0035597BBF|nr:hypothetical protein IUM83_11291 [Phytophthora cinnamomi]
MSAPQEKKTSKSVESHLSIDDYFERQKAKYGDVVDFDDDDEDMEGEEDSPSKRKDSVSSESLDPHAKNVRPREGDESDASSSKLLRALLQRAIPKLKALRALQGAEFAALKQELTNQKAQVAAVSQTASNIQVELGTQMKGLLQRVRALEERLLVAEAKSSASASAPAAASGQPS